MPSRSDRLQPAVDQAQRRQKDALQRLADHQQKLAHAEQQLEELQRYRRDYSLADGGLTVSALLNRQQFVDRIDQAIVQQAKLIERLQRQLEGARERWLQAHARENALIAWWSACASRKASANSGLNRRKWTSGCSTAAIG